MSFRDFLDPLPGSSPEASGWRGILLRSSKEERRRQEALLRSRMDAGDIQAGQLGIDAPDNTIDYLKSSLMNYSAGPIAGVLETAGLVNEGTRAKLRSSVEEERDKFLSAHPSGAGATASYLIDIAGNLPLALGTGGAGRLMSGAALAGGTTPAVARGFGAAMGAIEGGVLGFGDTADKGIEERALSTIAGAGLGTLGSKATLNQAARDVAGNVPWLTRAFSWKQGRPDVVLNAQQAAKGATALTHAELGVNVNEVNRAFKEISNLYSKEQREEFDRLILPALQGDVEAQSKLPPQLLKAASKLREAQDTASRHFRTLMMQGDENVGLLDAFVSSRGDKTAVKEFISNARFVYGKKSLPDVPDPVAAKADLDALAAMPKKAREAAVKLREKVLQYADLEKKLGEELGSVSAARIFIAGTLPNGSMIPAVAKARLKEAQSLKSAMKGLAEEVSGAYGEKNEVLKRYLRGAKGSSLDDLAAPAREHAARLKANLDALPTWRKQTVLDYMDNVETFGDNEGTYINRSFRGFTDPRYSKMMNEQSWRWKNYVDYEMGRGMSKEEAEKQASLLVSWMQREASAQPAPLRSASNLPNVNMQSLLEKNKKLNDPVLDFLGMERDWREAVERGVLRAADMANTAEAYNQILDNGFGTIFDVVPKWTKLPNGVAARGTSRVPGLTADLTHSHRFNVPDSHVVVTTPEIKAALELADQVGKDAKMEVLRSIVGAVNINLTALSPKTTARNIGANPVLALATGHPSAAASRYAKALTEVLEMDVARSKGSTPRRAAEIIARNDWKIKRGIFEAGGAMGETASRGLGKMAEHGRALSQGPEEFLGIATTGTKIKEAVKGAVRTLYSDVPRRVYSPPDVALRSAVADAIAEELIGIHPDLPIEKIYDMAADRAFRKVPTPSRTPPIAHWVQENLPAGQFLTFPTEILRTVYNNFEIGLRDLAEGNANGNSKLRMYGAKQIGSALGTLTAMAGIPRGFSYVAGKGQSTAERERAIQEFLPSYNENSQIVILPTEDPNELRYVDFGGLNPFSTLFRPFFAATQAAYEGEGPLNAALDGLGQLVRPYLVPKAGVDIGVQLAYNVKESPGGRFYRPINKEKSGWDQAKDYASNAMRTGLVPQVVPQVADVVKSMKGTGRLTPGEAVGRMFGMTIQKGNLDKLAIAQGNIIGERLASSRQIYNEVKNSVSDTDPSKFQRLSEAKAKAQQAWMEGGHQELLRKIDALRKLGKSDAQIMNLMVADGKTRLSKELVWNAINGRAVELRF